VVIAARDKRGRIAKSTGRVAGTRNKATMVAEALLDGEAEQLTRKCIELALQGNEAALRLCLERILPPRKERVVRVALPPAADAAFARTASAALLEAVAAGELTPGEGLALARLLDTHELAGLRGDVDRLLEANGLPRGMQPGEVAGEPNGHTNRGFDDATRS
jgi:hypothetical protein